MSQFQPNVPAINNSDLEIHISNFTFNENEGTVMIHEMRTIQNRVDINKIVRELYNRDDPDSIILVHNEVSRRIHQISVTFSDIVVKFLTNGRNIDVLLSRE